MLTSSTELCNLALVDLNADPITSLTDESDEARQCNARYTHARDATLRAHPWNFALKRASIASSATDTPAFEFAYSFPLPSDCLRVLYSSADDEGTTWKVEGRNIVTNESALKILYIYQVEDVGLFDALFVEALAARLASAMAWPIVGDRELQRDLWEVYLAKISEARGVDAKEGTGESLLAEDWEVSRIAGVGFSRFDNTLNPD